MKYKWTHFAIQVGQDARTPKSYFRSVLLRTTKNYYVDEKGFKYYRNSFVGCGVGDWARYRITKIERLRPAHNYRHMWE